MLSLSESALCWGLKYSLKWTQTKITFEFKPFILMILNWIHTGPLEGSMYTLSLFKAVMYVFPQNR